MKPERLSLESSEVDATKRWKHWHRTFENYLEALDQSRGEGDPAINKLRVLTNNVDFKVYDYIEGCDNYESAVEVLKRVYVKEPNTIFARHRLATAKQQPGQTLNEFLQILHSLSKDCRFRDVTAEVNRLEFIRDAFIDGLLSSCIRQRLLENRELDLETAFNQACSLELAQEHSQVYENQKQSQVMAVPSKESNPFKDEDSLRDDGQRVASISNKRCFFCGSKPLHTRENCPARNVYCYKCQKKGHFAKCCKSKRGTEWVSATMSAPDKQLCVVKQAPLCLSYATIKSYVNGQELSTVIDSGSSSSFINDKTARILGIHATPCRDVISLASSNSLGHVTGRCRVDVKIGNNFYPDTELGILEDLCTDLLLGGDFQKRHKRVVFEYNGSKPDLVVPNDNDLVTSVVAASDIEPATLFNNLSSDCRPIATKSRRFNSDDRSFISREIENLLLSDVIRPSTSPWRAQVLLVKNADSGKKRLCVDYSNNLFVHTFTCLPTSANR